MSLRALGLSVLLPLLPACSSGSSSDGSLSGPVGSPGGTGGSTTTPQPEAAPPPMGMGPSGPCTLSFTFTTLDNGGRYAPDNVSAVWIADANGGFVRTLEENGYIRESHLGKWEAVSGGNTVDAVTGATNRSFRTHQASWNCLDFHRQAVPAGSYTANAEFTSSNTGGFFGGPAPLLTVSFVVGSGPQTVKPPDEQYFSNISLTVQ